MSTKDLEQQNIVSSLESDSLLAPAPQILHGDQSPIPSRISHATSLNVSQARSSPVFPNEILLQIWKFSVPEPTTFDIEIYLFADIHFKFYTFRTDAKPSPLSEVCYSSRQELLRSHWGVLEAPGRRRTIRYRPEDDSFHFWREPASIIKLLNYPERPFVSWSYEMMVSRMKHVQNLIIVYFEDMLRYPVLPGQFAIFTYLQKLRKVTVFTKSAAKAIHDPGLKTAKLISGSEYAKIAGSSNVLEFWTASAWVHVVFVDRDRFPRLSGQTFFEYVSLVPAENPHSDGQDQNGRLRSNTPEDSISDTPSSYAKVVES